MKKFLVKLQVVEIAKGIEVGFFFRIIFIWNYYSRIIILKLFAYL